MSIEETMENVFSSPQRLPRLMATECDACHSRVYFQFRASVLSPDPNFRVVYLKCPCCGRTATQLQEIGTKKTVVHVKKHFRYRA